MHIKGYVIREVEWPIVEGYVVPEHSPLCGEWPIVPIRSVD